MPLAERLPNGVASSLLTLLKTPSTPFADQFQNITIHTLSIESVSHTQYHDYPTKYQSKMSRSHYRRGMCF